MGVMVEYPETYFSQWKPLRSDLLESLEIEARDEQIPIVGPVVGQLLYLLVRLGKARHLFELGTATGYSAIFMGSACQKTNGHLVSLESDPAMAQRARANINRAGLDDVIEVRCDDALKALQSIGGPLDMIFMDIEKEDYARALPLCKSKLAADGLLVADNTGFRDAHDFNSAIHEDPQWEMVNLWAYLPGHSPEQDGLCLAMKR